MNQPCPYRPLATRVIVKILPIPSDSLIVLPDGKRHLTDLQHYEVMAIGAAVNDDKFSLNVGDVVLLSCHESEVYPIRKSDKLIMVDRSKVVAVKENQTQN